MSVLYIEGFDLHQITTHIDVPGLHDFNAYWYTPPTFTNISYVDGYLSGRALSDGVGGSFAFAGGYGSAAMTMPAGQQVYRITWFARQGAPQGGTSPTVGFLMLGVDADYYGVRIDQNGFFQIDRGGFPYGVATEHISAASVTALASDHWQFFDLYMNFQTNVFQLKIDGNLECSGSLTVPHTVVGKGLTSLNRPNNFYILYDHIIVTDGEDLTGQNKIHAIAPTAAWSGKGTLRGNLIINDASYQTLRDAAGVDPHTFGSDNIAIVYYYLYPKNPSTNLPWQTADLDKIQGWGVCSGNLTHGGGQFLHLTSLGLSIVQTTNDPNHRPTISVLEPDGLTYYSGRWVKSDPFVSLSTHLKDIPRTALFANDKYIEIDEEGCILFKSPIGNRLLEGIGVTFAEEYREDFTDWYQLVWGGIPFVSYFITGYTILGEANKKFNASYVTVNYEPLEFGGAYFQGVWDYALTGDTGRWGTKQQVYRLSNQNYKYQASKLKVRGQGLSMQIKVTSEPGKDFRLNGWSTYASGNSAP